MRKIKQIINLNVSDNNNLRIDKFLNQKLDFTRSYIQNLINEHKVLVNDSVIKPNYKIKIADKIKIIIEEPTKLDLEPWDEKLEIIFSNEDFLVINKKPGISVHPCETEKQKTVVNQILYYIKDLSDINGVLRPGIVHRLDKDTTGCLIIAKNNHTHLKLSEMFRNREIKKEYRAVVYGKFKQDKIIIDAPLSRDKKDRKKIDVNYNGRESKTKIQVLKYYKKYNISYVKCLPETGRTHQIRVHLKWIKHPIIGDKKYNTLYKQKIFSQNLLLHAYRLSFLWNDEKIEITASLPQYFKEVLKKLNEEN